MTIEKFLRLLQVLRVEVPASHALAPLLVPENKEVLKKIKPVRELFLLKEEGSYGFLSRLLAEWEGKPPEAAAWLRAKEIGEDLSLTLLPQDETKEGPRAPGRFGLTYNKVKFLGPRVAFLTVEDGQNSGGYVGYVMPIEWVREDGDTWKLVPPEDGVPPEWGLELQEPPDDSELRWWAWKRAGQAAAIVNSAFAANNELELAALFRRVPFGWRLPVQLEDRTPLAERRVSGEDVLGVYRYNEKDKRIILYTRAIGEFREELAAKTGWKIDLKHLFAYVLAHELFHAWQDFHTNLYEQHDPEVETYAEYFAFRFVKDVLRRDIPLFDALCTSRYREEQEHGRNDYTAALGRFGSVKDDASEGKFLDDLKVWEKTTLASRRKALE